MDLRGNVIDTIALLTRESPDAVSEHASTIIISLLDNSLNTSINIDTRIAALKCLAVFPEKLAYLTIQSQKVPVIRGLGKVLDDKKKAIRKEAVDTRAKWYLLSGK
jgi:DNA repair/transcription protein MET18/MMS19